MKIGLFAQHAGLIDLLTTMWEGHDVRLAPRWDKYPKTWEGDEDVIVSTLPYDPESLRTGKPTIVYYTDPTFPEYQRLVQQGKEAGDLTVIGAEDCYPDDLFIFGVTQFIPFAVRPANYPPYTGWKPRVAVIQRKPYERWDQVVRGATGVGMTLEQFMEGIPYEVVEEWDTNRFRLHYTEDRVLFYYSNSPYTIVMFEAMTAGMPIVAFDHHHRVKQSVIHKYLTHYSIDRDQIRTWLKEYLDSLPKRQEYPALPTFDEVWEQWDRLFYETTKGKTA